MTLQELSELQVGSLLVYNGLGWSAMGTVGIVLETSIGPITKRKICHMKWFADNNKMMDTRWWKYLNSANRGLLNDIQVLVK